MAFGSKLEDLLGSVVLATAFSFIAYQQAIEIVGQWTGHSQIDVPALAGKVASFAFVSLVLGLTIIRHDAKCIARGLEARVTAVAGTFCLLCLIALPSGTPPAAVGVTSDILIVIGTVLSFWCALILGRSFSIAAAARQLVVKGPYAHVRHPLYAAEAVTATGLVLGHWSLLAALLLVVWGALQYRRSGHEETVLLETFPNYAAYATKVPRLLPALVPYRG